MCVNAWRKDGRTRRLDDERFACQDCREEQKQVIYMGCDCVTQCGPQQLKCASRKTEANRLKYDFRVFVKQWGTEKYFNDCVDKKDKER